MAILERHRSPDGFLELFVDFTGDDWTIGFSGNAWHAHGNLLYAQGYKGSPEEATRHFVDDILASRLAIVIWRVDGRVKRLGVPSRFDYEALNESLDKYGEDGETMEVRYWNGQAVEE